MNLWTESDNPELASKSVDRTQKAGTTRRTSIEQTVLPALRSWLLADYDAPYCRALAATRIFRRCTWIDALGSTRATSKKPGESQGRDGTLPAALQAIVDLAGELARESKPITLQGIALDNTKSAGTRFIASASPSASTPSPASSPSPAPVSADVFTLPKQSGVIRAGWREAAPTLLPAIEQTAAIFLLNPLAISRPGASQRKKQEQPQASPGTTMNAVPFLTADELARIAQLTAPTELCLLLMHRQIESVLLPALRSSAGAAAFTALMRNDRWKALLAKEGENGSQVDRVIDLWQAPLQPHFPFVQRVAFPVLIGPAAVEDAPCSLLFATRRQDSLACMNDAVCSYRRRLEQESRRGILNEAWFAAQQAERDAQALQQLSEYILREGRARMPRRWPDLRQQVLLERFGQWMLREYDEIMCRLLQADEVRCEWRQAASDALPCRVPGNEDLLVWQWKKRRY
jgi:hypothetical protein